MSADEKTLAAVKESVGEALGVSLDEVTPQATLLGDLGAESIDLLDMLFRVDRKLGVKIKAADITAYIQGMPEEEFGTAEGTVSNKGLAHLASVMPQIDAAGLEGKLPAEKVITLFTVQNMADMVAAKAGVTV
jgi:acyl carrier protein